MSILKTNELKKHYGAEANIVKALDNVALNVEQGEFVVIVGTSGSVEADEKELSKITKS